MRKGDAAYSFRDGHAREMSQQEVAEVLGISHQRVEQLERQALLKLRRGLRARGIEL